MSDASGDWKTVWITGASTGIGYALAQQISAPNMTIAVSARSKDKLAELESQSDSFVAYPVDVSDAKAVADSVDNIEQRHGPIDLAVLNAGTWSMISARDFDLETIRRGFEVNYMGVMNALHAVLPGMLARKKGHIAITASVAGYRGLPGAIAYSPTKAALINLAEILHAELSPQGITISLVNPGFVDTPMTQDNPFPMPQIITSKQAATRMLEGLKKQKFEINFPYRFTLMMKLLRILPDTVFFWLMRRLTGKK